MKIFLVAGARPNFMKIAPIIRRMESWNAGASAGEKLLWRLVHTGQHYDYAMSMSFFEDLMIPAPDYFLDAGSGSHAVQTAKIMTSFEKVCLDENPDMVLVVGDVNSTLACSITAKKLNIRVAHVEAGLRSRDMSMPEEINRMVTDAISDLLFVTEKSAIKNLRREGHREEAIVFVGNVMIDTLFFQLEKLKKGDQVQGMGYEVKGKDKDGGDGYAVVTLHRPSNVDDKETLFGIIEALIRISEDMPVIFPAHPRTKKTIEAFGLMGRINASGIEMLPPLPYMLFLQLWKDASLVLTDSGGLQEETTALGVPCFTIRENTERPVTIDEGTNILVGTTKQGILSEYEAFRSGASKKGRVPELWDGKAAERIVDLLIR
ncbi:MAG: UDP-N-acetylglucosamine 2-epimerase (non-hydrolyzing) [Syntrophales bacterium]|nr:UDP-N-acetylglucosamine 2-epimerase (non-hydrolyzing) [Syntrophales bacterium]